MERTTDLAKLHGGFGFTWGELVQIHCIAEYAVVEYHPWKVEGVTLLTGDASEKLQYSCYVDEVSLRRSKDSLDAALATCIAHERDGINGKAAEYFMKMIGEG